MSVPMDLRRKIEEDTALIEAGEETYRGLAKRYKGYNVKETDVYRIHQEKIQKMKVEGAKEELKALEEKKERLEREINELTREKREVKAAFEDQGLSWQEGVQTLKEVTYLRLGLKRLEGEEAATKARLKREKGKLATTRRGISNLESRKTRLQREINGLIITYRWYRNWYETEAPRLDDRRSTLLTSIYHLEKKEEELKGRLHMLKAEVKRRNGQEKEAKRRISKLGSQEKEWKQRIENLKSDYGKRREELQKECEKMVEESRKQAKMIVESAEQKRDKMEKEKGILEAEREIVRLALEEDVQKLRKKPREIRMRLSPEQFKALEKIAWNGDVEGLVRETIGKLIHT